MASRMLLHPITFRSTSSQRANNQYTGSIKYINKYSSCSPSTYSPPSKSYRTPNTSYSYSSSYYNLWSPIIRPISAFFSSIIRPTTPTSSVFSKQPIQVDPQSKRTFFSHPLSNYNSNSTHPHRLIPVNGHTAITSAIIQTEITRYAKLPQTPVSLKVIWTTIVIVH